jgi:hypothetical protein
MAGECRFAWRGGCLRGNRVAQRQGADSASADRIPCRSTHVRAPYAQGDRWWGCGDQYGTCRHDVVACRRPTDSTAPPPGDSAIHQPLRSRAAHYSPAVRRAVSTRGLRRGRPALAAISQARSDPRNPAYRVTFWLDDGNIRVRAADIASDGGAVQPPNRSSSMATRCRSRAASTSPGRSPQPSTARRARSRSLARASSSCSAPAISPIARSKRRLPAASLAA